MKQNRDIAILSDGMFPFHTGGMQSHTKNIIEDLSPFYDHLYIGLPKNSALQNEHQVLEQFSAEVQQKLKVILVDRPKRTIRFPGAYLLEEMELSKRLNKALREKCKDVKYIYAQGFTGWNKKHRIAPVLVHLHGFEFMQYIPSFAYRIKSKFLGVFFKKLIKKADYVISLGGKITDIIVELGVNKKQVLHHLNGLDELPKKPAKREGKGKRFLFVARNEKRKGFEDLIEAWKVSKDHSHLDVVGNYHPVEGLNNVTFHGEIKDRERINHIYQQSDFIVLPSYAEGMPMVLLEAACFGCIPICTNVGAIGSYFNKQNAIWIEVGSPDSIREAISKAEELDSLEVEKMRESFANGAEQFTRTNCSKSFVNQLREAGLD